MTKVLVESAIALDSAQQKTLETLVSKKIEGKAEFEYLVKPEILGGLRLTLGSHRYDVSLSGKLEQIKKQI